MFNKSSMFEMKFVVGVASACSTLALLACVVVIPSLYTTINQMQQEVIDGVQVFRVETDSAWGQMMGVQVLVSSPGEPRQNPFNSIFRSKRQTFADLPEFCICEPKPLKCPAGPPGVPGNMGPDGVPGPPGPPGEDNNDVIAPITCAPEDFACIKCPAGPPGFPGPDGPMGGVGPNGKSGNSGAKGPDGRRGAPGAPGDAGVQGMAGPPGSAGLPGQDSVRLVGTPGPQGPAGASGSRGRAGPSGKAGEDGKAGSDGRPGINGNPGIAGVDGVPGTSGKPGAPGKDAGYCPCPPRRS